MSVLDLGVILMLLAQRPRRFQFLPGFWRTGGSHLTKKFSLNSTFKGGLPWFLSCPKITQPVWPACWLDTPDTTLVVLDIWDVYREELGTVLLESF